MKHLPWQGFRFNTEGKSTVKIHKKWKTTINKNEYGYRSDSFDGGDGFIFLGCSFTYGDGLEEYETWPWMVGKYFDVKVWNLAVNGEGDDICFLLAHKWIPKLKPKVVCMLIPPPGRYYFFDDGPSSSMELYNNTHGHSLPDKPTSPWLFNERNMHINLMKNLMGIQLFCDNYEIPFIVKSPDPESYLGGYIDKSERIVDGDLRKHWLTINNPCGCQKCACDWKRLCECKCCCGNIPKGKEFNFKDGWWPWNHTDLARDNIHPGPKWQQNIADNFIEDIESEHKRY